MLELRNRPKGARFAFFGLGLCIFALAPTEAGYQDIASLLARQPGVAERWQKRVFSAVSSIQVATYSFGRPIGTSSPLSAAYRLASLEQSGHRPCRGGDAQSAGAAEAALPGLRFSEGRPHAQGRSTGQVPAGGRGTGAAALEDPSSSNASVVGAKTAAAAPSATALPLDPELQEALSAPPLPQYDVSLSLEAQPLDDLKAGARCGTGSAAIRGRRATAFRCRPRACISEPPRLAPPRRAWNAGSPAKSRSS